MVTSPSHCSVCATFVGLAEVHFTFACCAVAISLKSSMHVTTTHPDQFILMTATLLLAQLHKRPGASAVLARRAGLRTPLCRSYDKLIRGALVNNGALARASVTSG